MILLYVGKGVRQDEAVTTLRRFGATAVLALNEGAATQLRVKGTSHLGSHWAIPQAIAVGAAPVTPGGWHLATRRWCAPAIARSTASTT